MKRVIVATAALLAAACGGSSSSPITAQEATDALPASTQIKISSAPSYSGTALTERNALVSKGQVAPYAAETFVFATTVNVSVVGFLDVMGAIPTYFAPTSCAGETCTWGPGHSSRDSLDYQLTVTKVATDDYTWKFQARSLTSTSTADFKTLVSGEAFTTAQKHVGHGAMHVDFDAAASLGSGTDAGTLDVTYQNDDVSKPRSLTVDFNGVNDNDNPGQKLDVAYAYTDGTSGGDVQLAAKNLTSSATLLLHTRWVTGGAGRGDAKYTQGTNVATESQCWGAFPGFALGYVEDGGVATPPFTSADVSACGTFTTAVLPTITGQ